MRKRKPSKPAHISRKDWNEVDSPALTARQLKAMKPLAKDFPDLAQFARRKRGERGPQKAPRKIPMSIRVDADVLVHYKALGRGWQTRINEVLRRGMARNEEQ